MTQTSTTTHTLHLKHKVAASRARVFQAFTDSVELAKWWPPKGSANPVATSTCVSVAVIGGRCARPMGACTWRQGLSPKSMRRRSLCRHGSEKATTT